MSTLYQLLNVCVYLLYLPVCPSLDIRKINKQKSDLARKGHGIIIETRIIIVTRIFSKINSRAIGAVIALAARRKILKQENFCGASELMPPFRRNIFQHIHFQPIVEQIVEKKCN